MCHYCNNIAYFSYLLRQNLTMHRLSEAKACFLSESTEDQPKPDELVKLLDQVMHKRVSFSFNRVHLLEVSVVSGTEF